MLVIVVGGGRTGSHLAGLLLAWGHEVRVVEDRPEVVELLRREMPPETVVPGDGADPDVLERWQPVGWRRQSLGWREQ